MEVKTKLNPWSKRKSRNFSLPPILMRVTTLDLMFTYGADFSEDKLGFPRDYEGLACDRKLTFTLDPEVLYRYERERLTIKKNNEPPAAAAA